MGSYHCYEGKQIRIRGEKEGDVGVRFRGRSGKVGWGDIEQRPDAGARYIYEADGSRLRDTRERPEAPAAGGFQEQLAGE